LSGTIFLIGGEFDLRLKEMENQLNCISGRSDFLILETGRISS
jgi:hypothetical protein